MGMFEFANSHAAQLGSLSAMFLMALALFDLLPELHSNIMRILRPVMEALGIAKSEPGST